MGATLLAKRKAASTRTRPPAGPELEVRLPRSVALRRRTVLGALVLGPMAVGTSFAMLLLVIAAPTLAGQLFGAVVGTACATATIWWLYTRLRVACTAGRLTINHERIRIDDRALLRDPIVIHRSQLRGAAMGAADPDLGWVPVLGDAGQRPNLTMLFTEPLTAPHLRRRGEKLPPPGTALTALALLVESPDEVAAALNDWNALRQLDPEDAALHVRSARFGPLRRALVSRSERRGWILVGCGVIVPFLALMAIVEAFVLRETRPWRARVLAIAGFTVFAVRLALALTMGLGSPTCGA
jgi:hypothetical protein